MIDFTFTSDESVLIRGGQLFDGDSQLAFSVPSMNLSGAHAQLVENVNRFDFSGIPTNFGLPVGLDVLFVRRGNITFHAVGGF